MEKENNENLNKELSIKKVLFNILMVSLIILVLGFVVNIMRVVSIKLKRIVLKTRREILGNWLGTIRKRSCCKAV